MRRNWAGNDPWNTDRMTESQLSTFQHHRRDEKQTPSGMLMISYEGFNVMSHLSAIPTAAWETDATRWPKRVTTGSRDGDTSWPVRKTTSSPTERKEDETKRAWRCVAMVMSKKENKIHKLILCLLWYINIPEFHLQLSVNSTLQTNVASQTWDRSSPSRTVKAELRYLSTTTKTGSGSTGAQHAGRISVLIGCFSSHIWAGFSSSGHSVAPKWSASYRRFSLNEAFEGLRNVRLEIGVKEDRKKFTFFIFNGTDVRSYCQLCFFLAVLLSSSKMTSGLPDSTWTQHKTVNTFLFKVTTNIGHVQETGTLKKKTHKRTRKTIK